MRLTDFCNSAHIHRIHHLSPVLWLCVCLAQHWVPSTWQGGLAGSSHSILLAEWRHKEFTYKMTHAEWESDMWKRWGIYGLKEEKGPCDKGVTLQELAFSEGTTNLPSCLQALHVYDVLFGSSVPPGPLHPQAKREIVFQSLKKRTDRMAWKISANKNRKENIQQQKILKILAWSLVSQWNSRKHFEAPCPSWKFKRASTDSLLLVFMLFCNTSWVTSNFMGKRDVWMFQYELFTQHKHLYF